MRNFTLLDAATSTGAGPEVFVRADEIARSRDEALVQVVINNGTATVSIQGRLDASLPWVELASVTSSGLTAVARVPYIRANVTALAGANVTAAVFV